MKENFMGIDRSRRISFEEFADLYNESRPSYPEQLVEDVISLAKIPKGGRVLEIGCGPGNATIAFAKCGFEILAVELGTKLSAYAKQNCQAYPKVSILNMAFEDWPVEAGRFDLAISADAFHWVQPEVGYPMVKSALKPSGKLAFFWNSPNEIDTEISDELTQVYRSGAPQAEKPEGSFTAEWMIETISEVIAQSGCFSDVMIKSYPVTETLSVDHYIENLWTYSSHRSLDQRTRERLYDGIRKVLEKFGGKITTTRQVILFMAGKK
jgi:SAM-dependent methyltransferase